MRVLSTACTVPPVTVMSEYPHSTLKGTPTCSNHSSPAYYEAYVTGRQNMGVYIKENQVIHTAVAILLVGINLRV